jgi:hypothetical protein
VDIPEAVVEVVEEAPKLKQKPQAKTAQAVTDRPAAKPRKPRVVKPKA